MLPYFVFDQFSIGPIKINVWGLMVGLGFSAGYLLLLYLAKQKKLAVEKIAGLALAVFIGGVLGSRLLFLFQEPQKFFNDLSLLWSVNSGAMFMGGLIGAVFFGWLYIRRVKLNFWEIADLAVLPLCLGIGIARIGCLLINDHQGAPTSLPWGILWSDGIARHPVALYESLAGFLLFGVFWWIQKSNFVIPAPHQVRGKLEVGIQNSWIPAYRTGRPAQGRDDIREGIIHRREGSLFLLFLLSYSAIRFLLDFTRASSGPLADPHWGILTTSQWIAVFIAFFSLWGYLKIRSKFKTKYQI